MSEKAKKKLKKLSGASKATESSKLPVPYSKKASKSLPADPNSPLSLYLKEIRKIELLTPEAEKELAIQAYDHQSKEAVRALVQANLRFVVKIAFEFSQYGSKILDLIQEGNVGLIKAVHQFNPYKDVRLTSYAVWWIRSYMHDYLLRNWSMVRIGTTTAQKKLYYRLKKEQLRLERMGIKPEAKAIAMSLGVKEKEVAMMKLRLSAPDHSIDKTIQSNAGEKAQTYADRLPDGAELPDEELAREEQKTLFAQALDSFAESLNERDRFVLAHRLMNEKPMTLLEVGKRYSFSKERARQVEVQIKEKLKAFLEEKYPEISMNS